METGRGLFALSTMAAGYGAGSLASRGTNVAANASVTSIRTTGIVSVSGVNVLRSPKLATVKTTYIRANVQKLEWRTGGANVNALPNLQNARIDPNKISGYALNPNHPVGANKARVFNSSLGFNQSNANQLIQQIYRQLPNSTAVKGKANQFGQRFTVDMQITGPNGNTATVRTGWIIDTGSTVPRLTTVYVKN